MRAILLGNLWGHHLNHKTELLARAFYDAEHDDDGLWEFEAEGIKELFRGYALKAVALLKAEFDQGQRHIGALDALSEELKPLQMA